MRYGISANLGDSKMQLDQIAAALEAMDEARTALDSYFLSRVHKASPEDIGYIQAQLVFAMNDLRNFSKPDSAPDQFDGMSRNELESYIYQNGGAIMDSLTVDKVRSRARAIRRRRFGLKKVRGALGGSR